MNNTKYRTNFIIFFTKLWLINLHFNTIVLKRRSYQINDRTTKNKLSKNQNYEQQTETKSMNLRLMDSELDNCQNYTIKSLLVS